MKKLFILLTVWFIFSSVNAQTYVSGGIYSNTTWTLANSPYIVTDTVVVFPGVTLTIQPGVTVKFADGKYMEIRNAYLNAQGTATDSITFTSNSAMPHAGIWKYVYLNVSTSTIAMEFKYCVFKYSDQCFYKPDVDYSYNYKIKNSFFYKNNAGVFSSWTEVDSCIFQNNVYGVGGALNHVSNCRFVKNQYGIRSINSTVVKNCVIDSNTVYGIFAYTGDNIENCVIKNNVIGIEFYGGGCTIKQNIIEHNTTGIKLDGWTNGGMFCNKICNNTSYNVYNNNSSISNISQNYWCSNDSTAISGTVYDGYDNVSMGLVTFMPIDTSQCYLTGCNLIVSATVSNATCPTCNDGYATGSVLNGTPPFNWIWYTSPIQTTQTATGLTPGNYSLCVTDGLGCSSCNNNIYVDSTYCNGFSISTHTTDATCSTCNDGSAWVTVSGSTPPYYYTWYNSPFQNTDSVAGLAPGNYSVCVYNQQNCVLCDTVTISIPPCSAHFDLFPDSLQLHHYYAVNMASGVAPISYYWQWGDGSFDIGPYPDHTYAAAGFYSICLDITDDVGCTNHFCNSYYLQKSTNAMLTINVIPQGQVGTQEYSSDNKIYIYPNPATDNLYFGGLGLNTTVTIYDVGGKILLSDQTSGQKIDISSSPQGMYFIKFVSDKGSVVKKFVKY